MATTPTDAYVEAKVRRAASQQKLEAESIAKDALPAIAQTKLEEIAAVLIAETPPGLTLEAQVGPGKTNNGLKSLELKLFEDSIPLAQGSITVNADRSVSFTDLTAGPAGYNGTPKSTTFEELDAEKGIDLLVRLIKFHVV
jgi:hypothetical protein